MTGHVPLTTVACIFGILTLPHKCCLRSAVILVRRPLTPGHSESSENEEGAVESFGGDGLGIDPGVGIGAIEGLGPGFGLSEQALITPVMPMAAVVIKKERRCMARPRLNVCRLFTSSLVRRT